MNFHIESDQELKRRQPWGQIFIAVASVIIAVIGSKFQGALWFVYTSIPILLVAFVLMMADSEIGKWLRKKWIIRKNHRLLSRAEEAYRELIYDAEIAVNLFEKIVGLDWGNKRPPTYLHARNMFSQLKSSLEQIRAPKYAMVLFMNSSIKFLMEYIDGFLKESDQFIINRDVEYKYVTEKVEVNKLVQKYDNFRYLHDKFCDRLNKQLKSSQLSPFYGTDLSFEPKELGSESDEQRKEA